jgi:hypothetical protein
MMEDIETRVIGRPWKPGESGNPNGRPVGSRNAFSAAFLEDLRDVWIAHGKGAMIHTAKTSPEAFFATCARLIPRDIAVTLTSKLPANLDATDWQMLIETLDAIKQCLPDAGQRQPGEVMRYVLEAIRMANAPTIEG